MMPIGIDFTDYTVEKLLRRGFATGPVTDSDLYRQVVFPLESDNKRFGGFEIHVVHDEVGYLQKIGKNHFHPYVSKESLPTPPISPVTQPNGVVSLSKTLSYETLGSTKLRQYLELRKGFDLPAVMLKCKSLSEFTKMARPDMGFEIEGRPAVLIHLGPSCFDLVVVEAT